MIGQFLLHWLLLWAVKWQWRGDGGGESTFWIWKQPGNNWWKTPRTRRSASSHCIDILSHVVFDCEAQVTYYQPIMKLCQPSGAVRGRHEVYLLLFVRGRLVPNYYRIRKCWFNRCESSHQLIIRLYYKNNTHYTLYGVVFSWIVIARSLSSICIGELEAITNISIGIQSGCPVTSASCSCTCSQLHGDQAHLTWSLVKFNFGLWWWGSASWCLPDGYNDLQYFMVWLISMGLYCWSVGQAMNWSKMPSLDLHRDQA